MVASLAQPGQCAKNGPAPLPGLSGPPPVAENPLPRVAIIGNCQAPFIGGMMHAGHPGLQVDRLPVVFDLTDDDEPAIAAAFARADIIFLQRVSPTFARAWMRPASVRARYPGKAIVWPNLYFAGYFPDVQYLECPPHGRLAGPLEEYHLGRLLWAHENQLSPREAAAMLETTAFDCDDDAFAHALASLRLREAEADVPISPFLEHAVRAGQCFYTPNHPHNAVLLEMAARLMRAAGLGFDAHAAARFGYRLDRVHIPVLPMIAQREGIAAIPLYRGFQIEALSASALRLGAPAVMHPVALVTAFYRVYDARFPEHARPR